MAKTRKRNKIMLVFPPGKVHLYADGTPASRKHCSPPSGIAYLAANLLKHGYQVTCLDMTLEKYEREVFTETFVHYGMQAHELIEEIRKEEPDVIGFSTLFSLLAGETLKLCAAVKEVFPEKHIVLGGHHPSGAPYEMLESPAVDSVLVGEADETVIQFMEALNDLRPMESVRALVYRREDDSIVNTMDGVKAARKGDGWKYFHRKDAGIPLDLDALPFPAWHLFNMQGYWKKSVRMGGGDAIAERYGVMFTSRGCPNACTFCASSLTSGYRGYRTRTIDSVLDEIRWLVETYKVNEIHFADDNLFVNKKRIKNILRVLAQKFPDIIFCNTAGVEVNALDKEVVDLMAEANFHRAILAIEAGDEEVQINSVDKKVKLDRLPVIVGYLEEKNIDIKALYMIGFPGETRAQIDRTVTLARNLGILDFHLSIVTPLPGTPLWDKCVKEDLFLEGVTFDNVNFGKAVIKLPDTKPEELEDIRRSVWLEAFKKRRAMNYQTELRKKFGIRCEAMESHSTHSQYQGFNKP